MGILRDATATGVPPACVSSCCGQPSGKELADGRVDLLAPELFDTEVLGAVTALGRREQISAERAEEAVADLITSPVERTSHAALVPMAWSLRHNVSTNDAFYVALARELACSLLTTDGRLSRSPGLGIAVTLVT